MNTRDTNRLAIATLDADKAAAMVVAKCMPNGQVVVTNLGNEKGRELIYDTFAQLTHPRNPLTEMNAEFTMKEKGGEG